ncbi:condensation domain-containing protein [Umezawaea endophytica]|uniref:Condensation domain-containing protein n=1 Tax=Umezawaea endophytica TaxID=1654476 RepID=A0A9X2VIM3_9PSEU|nr:condensation domain-containing protein [Umezawaea endophytica]MCS7476767.1 condensation domain-containing protein [Umezawaea endophytica]
MSEPRLHRLGARTAPLSSAQERLWFIDAAAPGSPVYTVPLLVEWRGAVDVEALRVALLAVVERHEVLRTTYREDDGGLVQVIGEPRVTVEVVDHDLEAEARRGFDLAAGPLVRCAVRRGRTGGDAVLLTIHHIAVDGWSLAPLFEDLDAAYAAAVAGEPPRLPELPVQYADFAVWDRAVADEGLLARRADELATTPAELRLGGAREVPDGIHAGAQHRFDLPDDTCSALTALAKGLRVTPFVVLLAAYAEALSRWSAREEFLVGAVTANRTHPAVEDLVGFFVNTVPLRCTTCGATFAERCAGLRREAFATMTNQRVPYRDLVAALPGRGVVDVGFVVQNMPAPRSTRCTAPRVLPTGVAKFDVLLIIDETPDGLVGTLDFDVERYPVELGPRLAEDFVAVLRHGVSAPDAPLREFRLPHGPLAVPEPAPPWETPVVTTDAGDLTGRERLAAALFRDVLAEAGVDEVDLGRDSNFFVLGGHSLLAVSMVARAQARCGVAVRPGEFLAEPTVARLAALLDAGARTTGPVVEADDGPFPATSTQQRFWFLDRMPELRAAYLVPTVVEFPDDVDVEALRAALDVVLARHPALRSRFTLDRRRKQVVRTTSGAPASATVTDARGWDPVKLEDHVADLCWTPFDLADEAPVRAALARTRDRVLLVLCAHHMVVDGASVRVLLDEVDAVVSGRELPPPVRPAAVEAPADPGDLIAVLAGAPTDVALPHDRPRGTTQSILGATRTTTLDAGTAESVRATAAGSGCGTFLVTAALLAVTLARRGDQRDFLFAFPWSGRTDPHAVGMFVNTLALRVDLRGDPTWRELLDRVRRAGSAAYRAADVPFDAVVGALHPDRDLSRPPITPVYVAADVDGWRPPMGGEQLPLDPVAVKYELELTATDLDGGLRLAAAYQVDLFDETTITRLLAGITAAATDLVADLDSPTLGEN